jgi:putative transposase
MAKGIAIWARLRVLDGIRVSRTRILRVMGENNLLSPHRRPGGPPNGRVGRITTDAPNGMWATDATQIPTIEDRKVWPFGVVEHWNGEALGWNVSERGDRHAAAEAVGMAVETITGHLSASAVRGITLRHDHGRNFMADHFQKQIRFWGMTPSDAFVGEPDTNGVAERFFRTFKEQIVHGQIFQAIDEVRAAVRGFIAQYNASWLLEKNGFLNPSAARAAWNQANLRMAA